MQHFDVFIREASVSVGRNIEQECRVATDSSFVAIEYIISASYLLMCIVAVEPSFTYGSIGFSLLIVQILGFIELFAASQILCSHVGEYGSRVR